MRTVALYLMLFGLTTLALGAIELAGDGDALLFTAMSIAGIILVGSGLRTQKGWRPGLYTGLIVSLVLVILALSAAGLYSLMSVAVTRRTREIGIRLAIGASPRAVIGALFARAALQVGIGIVIANALLPALMKALGISELKLNVVLYAMLVASIGMLLVGLIACGVPARRALRIQATEAMKYAG